MGRPAWTEPAAVSWPGTALRFLREGFHHVLIGYDHIAFLLLLLLPSVLRRTDSGWAAATSGRAVVLDLLKIVTAFTIAHSVTLGLAATGAVRVPVQPVEVAIAASIVVAGLLNLFPAAAPLAVAVGVRLRFRARLRLRECAAAKSAADGTRLVPMLAGFNLGVEFAQLSIVALTLPVLWFLSRSPQVCPPPDAGPVRGDRLDRGCLVRRADIETMLPFARILPRDRYVYSSRWRNQ